MTAMLPDASAVSLRKIAEELPVPEGFRVEIIGGTIVVSPSPSGKHGRVVMALLRMLLPHLPEGYDVEMNLGVDKQVGSDDYYIPDLFVAPAEVMDTWDTAIPPDEVILVAEVVSASNGAIGRVVKREKYAEAGIPAFLLIDPQLKKLTLLSDPAHGRYRLDHTVDWGEKVVLPDPLSAVVDSSLFPSLEGKPNLRR